tara:strand:+ start:5460 stop:6008 length:549 start_codon:yes stop_codon:yes gene_type:complete
MKIINSKIFKDVKSFIPKVYKDNRGFFMESFNQQIQNIIGIEFLQDNHSKSKKGVIRGLHYQWDEPMGKLVRVPIGSGIDVIVDIRKESPTFGKWETFELSDLNNTILWVPPGFAHGFLSLENNTHLMYKNTALHNGEAEGSIHPLKSGLDIDWALPEEEILLSEKDKTAQTFEDYKSNPKF